MRGRLFVAIAAAVCSSVLSAEPRRFTILHTNDLHSHVQGLSPELDYSPLEPGNDAADVRDRINGTMFGVRAWTRQDLSRSTVGTILAQSGIGYSIGTLIVFATIAGMVIIGLTMYSAAVDRLRDYGTLKAIGADNGYIRNLILVQAVLFALVGYGLGVALTEGFRVGIANTGVLFDYAPRVRIGFFVLTVGIALGGAVFAMRRLARVEPASVFRG